jgi:hypothetical protein
MLRQTQPIVRTDSKFEQRLALSLGGSDVDKELSCPCRHPGQFVQTLSRNLSVDLVALRVTHLNKGVDRTILVQIVRPYGQKTQPTTKLCDNQQLEDQSCPEFGRLADAAGCHGV